MHRNGNSQCWDYETLADLVSGESSLPGSGTVFSLTVSSLHGSGGEGSSLGPLLFICLFVFLFMATPAAYGSSQARDPIGAATPGLCQSHGNSGSELHLQPKLQLMAMLGP